MQSAFAEIRRVNYSASFLAFSPDSPPFQMSPPHYTSENPAAPGGTSDASDLSLIGLLNVVLRRRWLIFGCAAAVAMLAGVVALVSPLQYAAESTFMPEGERSGQGAFSGMAAQFGIELGGAVPGAPSLALYTELVRTSDLLRLVVETEYVFAVGEEREDTLRGTLLDFYDVDGDTPRERLAAAVARLRDDLGTARDAEAGLVNLTARAEWPTLAAAVNRRLLELLAEFDRRTRQTRAAAEREFVERRMQEAQRELNQAEDSLQSFLERNRTWQGSSELQFQNARLQRRVDLRQRVYSSLAESYEQSRIEEVRNTPVFTVVDGPEGNVRDESPSLVVNVVIGTLAGVVIGLILAFLAQQFQDQRRWHPEEYREFERLRRTAARGLVPKRHGRTS